MDNTYVLSNGTLRPNTENLRKLFSEKQEKQLLVKTLLNEIDRGFLFPTANANNINDLSLLKNNAKDFYTELNTTSHALITTNSLANNVENPMLVYQTVDYVHKSGTTERVLSPTIILPKDIIRPTRDYSGGLLAFEGVDISGVSKTNSTLLITGKIETNEITIETFKTVDYARLTTETSVEVEDIQTSKSLFGLKKKTTRTTHTEKVITVEPAGNLMIANKVKYKNIGNLIMSGLHAQIGDGGISTENVDNIEEKVVISTRLENVEQTQRSLFGKTKINAIVPVESLHPTIINSSGPVSLISKTGKYDTIIIEAPSKVVKATEKFSYHLYLRELENRSKLAMAEAKEAKRTAKRQRKQGVYKLVGAMVLAYFGATIMVKHLIASSILVKGSITAIATKGALVGAISSVVQGQNPIKGAFKGAIFAGLEGKVAQMADGKLSFISNDTMRQAVIDSVPQITSGLAESIITKKPILESLIINSIANIAGNALYPIESLSGGADLILDTQITDYMMNSATITAITSLGNCNGDLLDIMASTGSVLGRAIGTTAGEKVFNMSKETLPIYDVSNIRNNNMIDAQLVGYSAGDLSSDTYDNSYYSKNVLGIYIDNDENETINNMNQNEQSDKYIFKPQSVFASHNENESGIGMNTAVKVGINIEEARNDMVNMIIHPWDTITNLTTFAYDMTLGLPTSSSRLRNKVRFNNIYDTMIDYDHSSTPEAIGMLTKLTSKIILCSTVIVSMGNVPIKISKGKPMVPVKQYIKNYENIELPMEIEKPFAPSGIEKLPITPKHKLQPVESVNTPDFIKKLTDFESAMNYLNANKYAVLPEKPIKLVINKSNIKIKTNEKTIKPKQTNKNTKKTKPKK